MSIVIDASIAIGWAFLDESDGESVAAGAYVIRARAVVPALWRWRCKTFARRGRRGRVAEGATTRVRRSLAAMPLSVDAVSSAVRFGVELELELTARRGILLATKDVALRSAAEKLDILRSPSS